MDSRKRHTDGPVRRGKPLYRRGRRARRQRRMRMLMRALPALFCVVLIAYGGFRLTVSLLNRGNTTKVNEELAQIRAEAIEESLEDPSPEPTQTPVPSEKQPYQYIGDAMLPESKVLHMINPDFVGWISLPGVFELPVVERDNTYYLDHDFYGRKNDSGTLFLDEAHPFEEDTQYLFIHGHNVYDGSMLGTLTHYRRKEFVSEHPYIYFNTLYREEVYEIFGVMQVSVDEMYGLLRLGTPGFRNGAEFNSFIESMRLHALRFTDKKLDPNDSILAISTCWEDERIVVLYKRVRP